MGGGGKGGRSPGTGGGGGGASGGGGDLGVPIGPSITTETSGNPWRDAVAPYLVPIGGSNMGGGGGKGGGVPSEFNYQLNQGMSVVDEAQRHSGKAESALPLGRLLPSPNQQQGFTDIQTQGQQGFGRAFVGGGVPTFESALSGLQQGMSEGFTGDLGSTVGQLGGILESSLRPTLQRSFDLGAGDIFEGAARSGTTRSSTTTDQLAQFRGGLENQLLGSVGQGQAGLLQALAPLQAQQRQQSTALGLGLPGAAQQFLGQPQQTGLQTLLQGVQLPIQALGAQGQQLGGIPYQQPSNKSGDLINAGGQLGGAYLTSQSGGGGKGSGGGGAA